MWCLSSTGFSPCQLWGLASTYRQTADITVSNSSSFRKFEEWKMCTNCSESQKTVKQFQAIFFDLGENILIYGKWSSFYENWFAYRLTEIFIAECQHQQLLFSTRHWGSRCCLLSDNISINSSRIYQITVNSSTDMRLDHQPHLEQFSAGQVYNSSKGAQVHVITASSPQDM